jgi:gliding motility-associated lipoprotein GldH
MSRKNCAGSTKRIIIKSKSLFRYFTYHRRINRAGGAALILIVVLTFASCDPTGVFEKNTPIDPAGWQISNKVPFELDVTDTLALLNFYINIRHTTDYKYRNIFLFVDTFFPEGTQSRDTIEIVLADAKGRWFGKGIGNIRSNQVLLKRGFSFPMKGHYKFRLEQGMREQELTGIQDVGIRIEKM